jgi:opacity protein-like surface antigen
LLGALAFLAVLLAAEARANEGVYVASSLGAVIPEDAEIPNEVNDAKFSFETGIGGELALGYAFADGFRAELSAGFLNAELDEIESSSRSVGIDGSLWTVEGFVTGYYDFRPSRLGASDLEGLALFAGVGVGVAYVDFDSSDVGLDADDAALAYRMTGGVAFDVSDAVTFLVQYEYLGTDEPVLQGIEFEIAAHKALAGVRLSFPAARPDSGR